MCISHCFHQPLGGARTRSLHSLAVHEANTRWQQPQERSAWQGHRGSRPPGKGVLFALLEKARVARQSYG